MTFRGLMTRPARTAMQTLVIVVGSPAGNQRESLLLTFGKSFKSGTEDTNLRTFFILTFLILAGVAVFYSLSSPSKAAPTPGYAVTKTDDEWKAQLSPQSYRVLRHHDTERPNSSPLAENHSPGVYSCAGCGQKLFLSDNKFDSGTGWPSFYQPADPQAVGTTTDYKLVFPRTEVHCSRCGGHLGHVFDDGPRPTGKRYCINGVALKFEPAEAHGQE